MATFEGEVTQAGWRVRFETRADDDQVSTTIAQSLAYTFCQIQTSLQAEGQRFIRQAVFIEEDKNGQAHAEEAETLTDSQVPHAST
jgi:hypothetical protein